MRKNRNSFFRRVLTVAMCLALALPCITVEARPSVKAEAEKPVKQFYKYAAKMDINRMSKYVARKSEITDGFDFPAKQGKEFESIVRKQNKKKLSYKIVSTTLSSNKKSATIRVKVSYRSLYYAGYYASEDCCEKEESYYYDHGKDVSVSTKAKWFFSSLKSWMKKYTARTKTTTITIKTKKYNNEWKITEVSESMKNSYTCDLVGARLDGMD